MVETGRVFISYRRDETEYPAGWLYDRLVEHLGKDQVFKDVDSIPLGDDFVDVITAAVAGCDVLLAAIGNRWLTITDKNGRRRLDDPHDFVRLEIEAALTQNVRVIPILFSGAPMPRADELPPNLASLARRQALELRAADFDTSRLLRALDKILAEVRIGRAQREAEAKAQREAEAKAQREAEAKAQREAEAKAQRETEAKAQRETEAKAQREAEAKELDRTTLEQARRRAVESPGTSAPGSRGITSTEDEKPGFWRTVPGTLTVVAVLVAAGAGLAVVLNQTGTDEPPAPFESAGMYEMAQNLFDANDCSRVQSSTDGAPLAWGLDPRPDEIVRCALPDRSFTGVFMCNDNGDVDAIRAAYLDKAVPGTEQDVSEPPAGWDQNIDGVQKSFEHTDGGSRVYWDSPQRGCAAELQNESNDVGATVDYWENGKS